MILTANKTIISAVEVTLMAMFAIGENADEDVDELDDEEPPTEGLGVEDIEEIKDALIEVVALAVDEALDVAVAEVVGVNDTCGVGKGPVYTYVTGDTGLATAEERNVDPSAEQKIG